MNEKNLLRACIRLPWQMKHLKENLSLNLQEKEVKTKSLIQILKMQSLSSLPLKQEAAELIFADGTQIRKGAFDAIKKYS